MAEDKRTDIARTTIQNRVQDTTTAIAIANTVEIRDLIHTVRGKQVMLDSDLAALYGVETRTLNQAVARNPDRFPERFCFQLTKEGDKILKSQSVISSDEEWGGRRKPHRVFTEQGVAMLSAALRSKTAVEVSVRIMDSFVEMRHFIASNAAMFEQVRSVELKLMEYQHITDERFERVFEHMEAHEAPKQRVFFEGQIYDAFELLTSLVRRAQRSIVLVDGYVDAATLNVLAKKAEGVVATVWTHPKTKLTQYDIDAFNAQYPQLTLRHTTAFHDRLLVLDDTQGYFVGASLKDAGKKCFAISRIEDVSITEGILAKLKS